VDDVDDADDGTCAARRSSSGYGATLHKIEEQAQYDDDDGQQEHLSSTSWDRIKRVLHFPSHVWATIIPVATVSNGNERHGSDSSSSAPQPCLQEIIGEEEIPYTVRSDTCG